MALRVKQTRKAFAGRKHPSNSQQMAPLLSFPRKPLAILISSIIACGYISVATVPRTAKAASIPNFSQQTGSANPFADFEILQFGLTEFADLDGDGDLDAIVGGVFGTLDYFENTGNANNPVFTARTGTADPFDGLITDFSLSFNLTPMLADVDSDGDLDAIIGNNLGVLNFFENTGTATSPNFEQRTGSSNPLNNVDVANISTPNLIDIDGDGDLDAIVSSLTEGVFYFENTGTATTPNFVQRAGSGNIIGDFGVDPLAENRILTHFVDVDSDGDVDALLLNSRGEPTSYFENTGTAISPTFTAQTDENNPFTNITSNYIGLDDIDGDGDQDAIATVAVDGDFASFQFFSNDAAIITTGYVERTGTDNPLNGFTPTLPGNNVDGFISTPSLGDIDGDGDLDVVSGEFYGTIVYFENTGDATTPVFVQRTGNQNPFDSIDVGFNSHPALADLDNDGDLDITVGNDNLFIGYFENTGSAIAPTYVQRSGTDNPFNDAGVGTVLAPTLADIDGDGDLDAIVGEGYGTLFYFENTGSATAANFVQRASSSNPFDDIDVGGNNSYSSPSLRDIDGDGDLDALIGGADGTLNYFENTGTSTTPNFIARTGGNNPFDGFSLGTQTAPAIADIDADGDLDAFVGSFDGTFKFLESTPVDIPIPAPQNDFTGDKKADILARNNSTGLWRLHPVEGRFVQFDDNFGLVSLSADLTLQTQDVSDFTGDGLADVLLRNTTTGAWTLTALNGKTVVDDGSVNLPTDLSWQLVAAEDFTGDGKTDVVLRHTVNGTWQLYPMDGRTVLQDSNRGSIAITADLSWSPVAASDFNGDGFSDLLLRNTVSGLWLMIPLQGRTVIRDTDFGGVPITQDLSWEVAGDRDLTGDGSADLLLRNNVSGQWLLLPLNGKSVDRGNNFGGIRFLETNLDWQPVQVDDFTGDGKADIVIRNIQTGAWRMHPMNGNNVVRDSNFGGVAVTSDLNWELQ